MVEQIRLIREIARLREQVSLLTKKNRLLENQVRYLEEKVNALIRKRYRKKSEKLYKQLLLPGFEEYFRKLDEDRKRCKEIEEEIEYTVRRKKRALPKPDPSKLQRVREEYDLGPEERICPHCKGELVRIGEEVTEQYDYIPAKYFIRELVRAKYACKNCEGVIKRASLPARPIEKGKPGAGLLAHVAVSKYADHLPLYRQEQIMARGGISLRRSTMCDWLGEMAYLLEPIVSAVKRQILSSPVVQSDDTPVQVKDPDINGKTHRGYLWVYTIPYGEVVFDFTSHHRQEGPVKFLGDFKGYLQTDAHDCYNGVFSNGKVIHIGCMAHARRKFYEAKDSAPEEARWVLTRMARLYKVERELKERGASPEERVALRQRESLPLLLELKSYIGNLGLIALPKSPLGRAVAYFLKNFDSLCRYTEVGEAEIDNNSAEQAIKNVVIGRKNWLFLGHPKGGPSRATVFYSLIVSCKRLKIDPFAYLRDIIDKISQVPDSEVWKLTPRGWLEAQNKAPPS